MDFFKFQNKNIISKENDKEKKKSIFSNHHILTCKPFSSYIKVIISKKDNIICEIDHDTYNKLLMKCRISKLCINKLKDCKKTNIKFNFKYCKIEKKINRKMLFSFKKQIIKTCRFKGALYMSLIDQLQIDEKLTYFFFQSIKKYFERYRCICKIEKQLKNFILNSQFLNE